ncbi:MAG: redoxin domain-containing protein [Ilumatobacteraceae bacterium]
MSVGIGDRAPAFRLPATGGSTVALDDFAGEPVVLVFYPGDDTPVCTKQLSSYSRDLGEF